MYTIEDLIEMDKGKVSYDNAKFMDSTEKGIFEIESNVEVLEILKTGALCGIGGSSIGRLFGGYGAIVGGIFSAGIGCYLEYKVGKEK